MDKKKILIILGVVAVILLILIVVLSITKKKPDDNNGDNGNNNPTETVTLEYWGLWESEAIMQPIINEYQNANPNVKIVYTQKSFNQYETTLFTRLQQGATSDSPAPDIFRINNTWLTKFQSYLSPLPSSIMSPSDYTKTFYSTCAEDFSGTDMSIYAIPLEIDGLALYYNKEMLSKIGLSKPPEDWDTLIEVAKQLTVKDTGGNITVAGLGMGGSTNVKHSADILSLLFLQNGAQLTNSTNNTIEISSQKAVDALDFYTSFVTEHEVWSNDLRSDLEMFYRGELAMMFGPSWRAFDIINSNPTIEFGVAPTPTLIGDEVYYSMYWGEAVASSSENQVEAWKFIKYLSQKEQLREYHNNSIQIGGRAFGEPYSRIDMATDLQSNVYIGSIIKMAPKMKSWKMGEQSYIEAQLRTAINDVVVNEVESYVALKEAEDTINEKFQTTEE